MFRSSYLAYQLANLPPNRSASGSEWEFQIFTVKRSYWQINWQIYSPIDLPVDLNGNFRLLLLELILGDEVADLPPPPSSSIWW